MKWGEVLYPLVLLIAVWAAWPRGDEDGIPATGAGPVPALGRAVGLTLLLSGDSVLRAESARPHQGGGLVLGGSVLGLDLERPRVSWSGAPGTLSLEGERGSFTSRGLELEGRVRLSRGDRVLMDTPRCLVSGSRIALPEIAVWSPGTAEERIVRARTLHLDRLPPELR